MSGALGRRFEILRCLGEGGMGLVYEAFDRERNARVALKRLRHLGGEAILRFKAEFRALQDIHHENLVALGELLEEGGHWSFTMELVEGVDLLAWVRPGGTTTPPEADTQQLEPAPSRPEVPAPPVAPGTFDVARARAAFSQLVQALDVLHQSGKVHRDVKPSNVRVTDEGRVVLLDFGLVTEALQDRAWSELGVVGTPDYMAPEQAAGQPVGPAGDLYGVGVVLYQALTGRLPYGGSQLQVLMDKQHRAPARPEAIAPGVPAELAALAMELLRFDPSERPGTAAVLRRLGAEARSTTVRPRSASSHTQTTPFVGRAKELAALEQALGDVRAGRPVTVLVEGEAGIGKSALVRRFAGRLAAEDASVVVLAGRCYERETVPFKAMDGVIDALSRYLVRMSDAEASSLLPVHAGLLASVFQVLRRVRVIAHAPRPPDLDPQEQRSRVFAALRELLVRLGLRKRLVVCIEDLQWADADSLALLAGLMRSPDAPTLLLVATVRRGSATATLEGRLTGQLVRVAVEALPPDDAWELASLLVRKGGSTSPADPAAIATEARGHPLYIDELVRHALEAGVATSAAAHLDDALWQRIERLDPAARRLLECIVIAGAPIKQETAQVACSLDPLELAQRTALLRVAYLVRTSGARATDPIEPYHDRVRDAVLSHLDATSIRLGHQDLALALEAASPVDPESLWMHWLAAGHREKAATYAERAANRAAEALAFDRAARLYRVALDLRLGEGADLANLRERLGDALANAGRGKEAAESYFLAAEGASSANALDLRRRAAEQLLRCGHIDEGVLALGSVLDSVNMRLPPTPRRALLSLLWQRTRLRLRGFGFRERDETQVAAEELRRIDVCWSVAIGLGIVDNIRGTEFQTRHLLLALSCGERRRVLRAMTAEIAFLAAGGGRSARRTERLMALAEGIRTSDPFLLGMRHGTRGMAAYLTGRWRAALEGSEKAEEIFRDQCTGVSWELGSVRSFAVWALHYLGELQALSRRVPVLLQEAEQRGDRYTSTNLRLGSNNLVWLIDDAPARARAEAERALAQWSPRGYHLQHFWTLAALGQIDLYEGEGARAHRRVLDAWPRLRSALLFQIELTHLEALHLRGRAAIAAAAGAAAGDAQRLLTDAERAARTMERTKMAWARALAALLRAGIAARRGEAERAAERLAAAETALSELGMALHRAAARHMRGLLVGGDEGAALVAESRAWAEAQGVRSPERFFTLVAPGFGGP